MPCHSMTGYARIDGAEVDLAVPVPDGAEVSVITACLLYTSSVPGRSRGLAPLGQPIPPDCLCAFNPESTPRSTACGGQVRWFPIAAPPWAMMLG